MTTFKSALLLLIGSAAAVASLGAASAAPADGDVPTMVVRYNPNTLTSEVSVRALYARLRTAAEHVCPAASGASRIVSEGVAECRRQALADAVEKIHNTRLAEIASRSNFS
jgi:UrcA family protein